MNMRREILIMHTALRGGLNIAHWDAMSQGERQRETDRLTGRPTVREKTTVSHNLELNLVFNIVST